jgi:hypothetical protein
LTIGTDVAEFLGNVFREATQMNPYSHKIQAAIQECLQRCYQAKLPIACMTSYLSELTNDSAWRADEVEEVEQYVRRELMLDVPQSTAGRNLVHYQTDASPEKGDR